MLTISLCNPCTDYDTKLYVLDNCPGRMPIACNDDACSTLGFPDADVVSEITGMPVTAGVLYFIYVDGNGLDCAYELGGPPMWYGISTWAAGNHGSIGARETLRKRLE